jgi:outer membrane lipoprotein LolB
MLGTTLLLGGCGITPQQELSPITVTEAKEASAWELQGKLAVRTPEEKFSTNLYWLHTGTRDELKLTTMLGTTVLSLISAQGKAVLEVDGKRFEDSDPQRLLDDISGWSIPLASLPLWITGQVGDSLVLVSNADGTPRQLQSREETAPWLVDFVNWQRQSGAPVPAQLRLRRNELQLKIQLTHWQALDEPQGSVKMKNSKR